MTERPVAVSPPLAAARRDVLLSTKLHAPGLRPGFVARPRLTERLDEALGRGLVLVCAPAGYGKTALLAGWAEHCERPVAWLSLDAGDNDPARFWRHAVAALDRVCPGVGERVGPLLGPPSPPSFEGLVTALINELAARPGTGEVPLVLDDYHLVGSQPVHASLGFLLEHLPPGLHPVLASRADPPLALARLRARGQLTELRDAELRFTAGEAADVLREISGAELPGAMVTALAARTEGWAAGLQLAALSLRGQANVAEFVAAFTGSHRYVLDYLAEEVLEQQSGQVRDFLLETSVLDRLSGPLCDAVTGRAGSQALLEQVERAGLFLVPLDEVRGWWRYHHLFADLLRVRLQQEQPGQSEHRHCNAAAWYEKHGLAEDAIRHAVAAGEMLWAARLIEQDFDAAYNLRGEGETIQRWLSALPADLVRSRPRLLLAQAQLRGTSGHLADLEQLVDAAERVSASGSGEPFEPTAGPAASLLVNVPAHIALERAYLAQLRGDAEGTAAFSSRALAESRAGESLLTCTVQGFLAVAEWLRGRLAEANGVFTSGVAGWRAAGLLTHAAWGGYSLAQVQCGQGRLDAAIRTCRQALEAAETAGRRARPAAGLAYVGLGGVAYQRNELDIALRHVTEGIPLCRQFVYTPPLAFGLATLAWIRQATGDPAGALAAIGEAAQAAPVPAGPLNPVPAQRARLLLAQGDVDGAARWTKENGLGAEDDPRYASEPEHLVLARVLLAQGRPGQALALLDRLYAAAVTQDRTGNVIEAGALRALALAAMGQDEGAVTGLAGALTLACPQGYVRVFADEGPPMAALLGQLIASQRAGHAAEIPLACLARLQRAFNAAHPTPGPRPGTTVAVPGIVEPLTSRELEVLGMLAAGRSNQAIASQLVVTVDTVKKHVSHVLSKLGAANRTEAVSRARRLDLIP